MKTPTCGNCEGCGDPWNEWICSQCSSDIRESVVTFDKRKWERRRKRIEIRWARRPAHSEYKWVAIMAVDSMDPRTKVYPIATPNGLFVGRGDTVAEAVAKLRREWKRDLRRYLEQQEASDLA